MSSINNVSLTGRMTADPELRTTATGKSVTSFTIAVDKKYKTEEKSADFFRVTVWESSAEFLCNYGGKGRMVGVSGRLEQKRFINREGVEIDAYQVVADDVCLLDRAKESSTQESTPTLPPTATAEEDYDPFAEE